mgnify:CR=1 FL=1
MLRIQQNEVKVYVHKLVVKVLLFKARTSQKANQLRKSIRNLFFQFAEWSQRMNETSFFPDFSMWTCVIKDAMELNRT